MQPLRALRAVFGLVLIGCTLLVGLMALPGVPVAADDAPVVSPTAATALPSPTPQPYLAGAYNGPYIIGAYNGTNGFFVSINDPHPYSSAGCPDGDNLCLASGSRDDR